MVIRSHDAINTTNVHFEVHPKANLTFSAKAVAIARDEVGDVLIVYTISECYVASLMLLLLRLVVRPVIHTKMPVNVTRIFGTVIT